ncbi:hydA [Symbiodinium microadriaticum]|nr:hydA [Symbiodinium microadriaticum]
MKTVQDILKEQSFFVELTEKELAFLAGCGQMMHFKPGEYLGKEGEPAKYFFILRKGRIAVQLTHPSQGAMTIKTLSPGEYGGFSWIIPPFRMQFDLLAQDHTSVVAMDGECVRKKCEEDHDLGFLMMKQAAQIITKRLNDTRIQLLDVYKEAPNIWIPIPYRVIDRHEENDDLVTLLFEPATDQAIEPIGPGQFNMLYAFGKGEIPISVSSLQAQHPRLIHTVQRVGAVSGEIFNMQIGDQLGIRGPFGTKWPLESAIGRDIIIMAGGVGLAPLRPVIEFIEDNRTHYEKVNFLYGTRDPKSIIFHRDVISLQSDPMVNFLITVDHSFSNWHGNVGVVTNMIDKARFSAGRTTAFVCGPEIMIRYGVYALLDAGVDEKNIYVSMERNMKCAIGHCGHCQFGSLFVCKDGAVFPYPMVKDYLKTSDILDCEDELLAIADAVDIAYFPEATQTILPGPYDISLVEGSITTPHDALRILEVRKNSSFVKAVYAKPEYIDTLETSTAISDHVKVDFELRGCPINKYQLIETLTSFLHGKKPNIPDHSVCVECKLEGNPCVAVARGLPCLGPVTQAGCGALCPRYYRGCFGCYGPTENPNTTSLANYLAAHGNPDGDILRLFRNFNSAAPAFAQESEGSFYVKMKDDKVEQSQLKIFEPPRFFEGFLKDRSFREAPDITARICGICPVAYQMSSVHAMEQICGFTIDPVVRALRRLLYCGEWIESHALHTFMLHAPDFLGYPDAITMAKDHKEWVKKALTLKKTGNDIVNLLGGREIHPINVKIGGFYRYPQKEELMALHKRLLAAMEIAYDATLWMSSLEFPAFTYDYEFLSMTHPDEYPMNEGRLISSRGLDLHVDEYEDHFTEEHMAYSTTLHTLLDKNKVIHTGPLARFNLNFNQLSGEARSLAKKATMEPGCINPFKSLLARMIETFEACGIAIKIIEGYRFPTDIKDHVDPKAGTGRAVTEAPRGILFHRYEIDRRGLIRNARIVAPTSHNQRIIEVDLRRLVEQFKELDDDALTAKCEHAVRNYDPCISCSTHFLNVKIERE